MERQPGTNINHADTPHIYLLLSHQPYPSLPLFPHHTGWLLPPTLLSHYRRGQREGAFPSGRRRAGGAEAFPGRCRCVGGLEAAAPPATAGVRAARRAGAIPSPHGIGGTEGFSGSHRSAGSAEAAGGARHRRPPAARGWHGGHRRPRDPGHGRAGAFPSLQEQGAVRGCAEAIGAQGSRAADAQGPSRPPGSKGRREGTFPAVAGARGAQRPTSVSL